MPNVSRDELRTVPVFHDLPDDQLDWFLQRVTEQRLAAGDTYVRAGDPADRMVVVLEGELQAKFPGADERVFTTEAGNVSGILPYSRMTIFPANGRAVKPSRLLTFQQHFSTR